MSPADATAIVLIAHGSRASDANAAHVKLARMVADRTEQVVIAAFLELAEPDIDTAIDQLVSGGATTVALLPHFLLPGNHTQRDIPAAAERARERHPEVAFELLAFVGADPHRVADLLEEIVDEFDDALDERRRGTA